MGLHGGTPPVNLGAGLPHWLVLEHLLGMAHSRNLKKDRLIHSTPPLLLERQFAMVCLSLLRIRQTSAKFSTHFV